MGHPERALSILGSICPLTATTVSRGVFTYPASHASKIVCVHLGRCTKAAGSTPRLALSRAFGTSLPAARYPNVWNWLCVYKSDALSPSPWTVSRTMGSAPHGEIVVSGVNSWLETLKGFVERETDQDLSATYRGKLVE